MRYLVTLLMLFASLLPAAAAADTTGALSGQVVDLQTGRPIADARVAANSPSAIAVVRTNAQGYYVFMSLPPGKLVLSVTASGYELFGRAEVGIVAGYSSALQLRMAREIGTVLDAHTHPLVVSNSGDNVFHLMRRTAGNVWETPGRRISSASYRALRWVAERFLSCS